MVLVENDSNEIIYVRATQERELAVNKRIAIEVQGCFTGKGVAAIREIDWQCAEVEDFTALASKDVLEIIPVVGNKTFYVTIKSHRPITCDALPIRTNRNDIVDELLFIQNARKKNKLIYRVIIKLESGRKVDNSVKVKDYPIERKNNYPQTEICPQYSRKGNLKQQNQLLENVYGIMQKMNRNQKRKNKN